MSKGNKACKGKIQIHKVGTEGYEGGSCHMWRDKKGTRRARIFFNRVDI